MTERLILLPGWGLGLAPLRALGERLGRDLDVQLEPLPDLSGPDWLDTLDASLPDDGWLAGWSLGGMLAAMLAARRQARCAGLITLASNASFVARDDWPFAMQPEVFAAFRAACADHPVATLKRFALLCAQGAVDARGLGRLLSVSLTEQSPAALLAGLDVLGSLDIRPALQAFEGRRLHLFGDADALVPAQAAQQGDTWSSASCLSSVSHAFPVERPDEVAAAVVAFVRGGSV